MKNNRIVFMGTPKFASNVLEGLINEGYNIVAVVTQKDAKVGRKQVLKVSPVKEVALKYGLDILQPSRIKEEYESVLAYKPDLIITCAYGQIVPRAILDYPKYKCVNTHGSLLPKYRGGAPIQRAIINGEKETGITLMYMAPKMDAGDILFQEKLDIDINDTNASLFDKLSDLALKMLIDHLEEIMSEDIKSIPQNHDEATFAYNLSKEDEYINFNDDVLKVYNHIRGLLDNPGAYSKILNTKLKFHKLSYNEEVITNPREFYGLYENKILIGTKNGSILIEEIQAEGKNKLTAKEFMNGMGKKFIKAYFDEQD